MKWLLSIVAVSAFALVPLTAVAQTADDAFGIWTDPNTNGQLETYKCGEGLCAKISAVPPGKEEAKDVNNENTDLRDRLLLGLVIIENATKSDDTAWSGVIYDRERGKSFDATVRASDKNTLEIKGCKMVVLCKTRTLARAPAQPAAPAPAQ